MSEEDYRRCNPYLWRIAYSSRGSGNDTELYTSVLRVWWGYWRTPYPVASLMWATPNEPSRQQHQRHSRLWHWRSATGSKQKNVAPEQRSQPFLEKMEKRVPDRAAKCPSLLWSEWHYPNCICWRCSCCAWRRSAQRKMACWQDFRSHPWIWWLY